MKRAFTLIELVVVLAIIGILFAILAPVFQRPAHSSHSSSCRLNLKQVGLGFLQYAQDYDERFPPVASNAVASSTAPFATPYGWADALQPYLKSTEILQCPSEASQGSGDATELGFTDYYFNTSLDRRPQKLVSKPALTFLCGEGNPPLGAQWREGTDARYNRNVLPQFWSRLEESPARRHRDMANYLFADGHVKSLKPEFVQAARTSASNYAFAL